MGIWIDIIAILLGIIGLAGCILPILPGPPISYVGLLLIFLWGNAEPQISSTVMIVLALATVAVVILDYIVPAYFTKKTGGSKAAARGALAGMIVGLVVPPIGMIIGAFLGAFLAELIIEGKDVGKSLKSAFGSFLGFLAGTGLKLICSGVVLYYIIVSL